MGYKDPDKQREYQRKWNASRRAEFFRNKVCAHCGIDRPLQLDHMDPAQKVQHNVWTWAKERRETELAKCQALCANCHRIKTLSQRRKAQHGGAQMYMKYKCRCDLCKAWKLASSRKYKKLGPVGLQVKFLPHGLVS